MTVTVVEGDLLDKHVEVIVNAWNAEKYEVSILPDCCTTVSEILHNIALHAVSTLVKLVPAIEVL